MKTITIAFVVLMLSLATFVACDESAENKSTCVKEGDVDTEDEIRNFFDHGMKLEDATENVKCFVKCFMELEGYIKDGVLLENPTIDAITKEGNQNAAQIYNDCKGEMGVNDCDTAFKMMMCYDNHELNVHI